MNMREMIALVENARFDDDDEWDPDDDEGQASDEVVTLVNAVQNELRMIGGEDADRDDIIAAADELRPKISGWFTVYRIMRLPEDFIANLKPGVELGNCWSMTSKIPSDKLYDMDRYPEGKLFIFTAETNGNSINFPHAVAFNILFPEEEEVFLNPHGALRFRSVSVFGDRKNNLRPDLIGKSFNP